MSQTSLWDWRDAIVARDPLAPTAEFIRMKREKATAAAIEKDARLVEVGAAVQQEEYVHAEKEVSE